MDEILEYLYNLKRFGIKPGTGIIKRLLQELDNPHKKFRSIHVAGTNGKGSTCAYLASIIAQSGQKVGLYTSPHLVNFNERIKINGVDISDEEIVYLAKQIRYAAEKINIQPTFFEFTTTMAFLFFASHNVDLAIIETGFGGLYDATNVVVPELCILTPISLDHTKYLGNSLKQIAMRKAGIIKPRVPVVIGKQDPQVIAVLENAAFANGAKVFRPDATKGLSRSLQGQSFLVDGVEFSIPLLGSHQLDNAAVAIKAAALLGIENEAIIQGIAKTQWPGRLHVQSKKPFVMLDGAHNVAGMKALAKFMKSFPFRHTLILGFKKEKPLDELLEIICPLFKKVIITKSNFQPEETFRIAQVAKKYASVDEYQTIDEALRAAFEINQPILVTGSLYLVGDVLKELNKQGIQEIHEEEQ